MYRIFYIYLHLFNVNLQHKLALKEVDKMKCDLLVGLLLGAITGMAILEFCQPVKDAVEQGKQKVKSKLSKM